MLKVGELAQRTGLTVRTLHHYDSIGLLRPSARSDAGYRLYDRNDVARLQQIQALRKFGMALSDIGAYLDSPGASPLAVVDQQIASLDQQIDEAARMRDQLKRLRAQLAKGEAPELATWLTTLEQMTMYEKYFTQQDLDQLVRFRSDASKEAWQQLVAEVQQLMDTGAPPESDAAVALGRRWADMLERATGGSHDLMYKLDLMHQCEPEAQRESGITPELRAYVVRAIHEPKLALYAKYLPADVVERMRRHHATRSHEWLPLIAKIKAQIAADPSPRTEPARELVRQWRELLVDMIGPDQATLVLFRKAVESEASLRENRGMTDEMVAWLRAAMA